MNIIDSLIDLYTHGHQTFPHAEYHAARLQALLAKIAQARVLAAGDNPLMVDIPDVCFLGGPFVWVRAARRSSIWSPWCAGATPVEVDRAFATMARAEFGLTPVLLYAFIWNACDRRVRAYR